MDQRESINHCGRSEIVDRIAEAVKAREDEVASTPDTPPARTGSSQRPSVAPGGPTGIPGDVASDIDTHRTVTSMVFESIGPLSRPKNFVRLAWLCATGLQYRTESL